MDYHDKPLADRIALRVQEYLTENVDTELFDSDKFRKDISEVVRDVLDETYGDY